MNPDETQDLDGTFFFLWSDLFKKLAGRIDSLKLWGCYVGANWEGADLLFELATLLNCPVAAPTGAVSCGGGQIIFEDGSVWQGATPASKPAPIANPHPEGISWLSSSFSEVVLGSSDEPVPLSAIDRILISDPDGGGSGVGNGFVLINKQSSEFIRTIDVQHPYKINGALLAQRTGSIQIDVAGKSLQFLGTSQQATSKRLRTKQVLPHLTSI